MSTASHVPGSPHSNGGVPRRDPIRTVAPRSHSRSATRRPVVPVPPITSVVVSAFIEPHLRVRLDCVQ